jgi:hypothetical protein
LKAQLAGVDRGDRNRGADRYQSPHGGGETRDPFACFEGLIDEGSGERERKPDPEHNRQASDLVFQGRPLADQFFLRAMISERSALAASDFTCTGLKKPVRPRSASQSSKIVH